MTGRGIFVAALLAGAAAAPLAAQTAPAPSAAEPSETPQEKAEAAQQQLPLPPLLAPDGKPLPPGTTLSVIGPDGKPLPVKLGPDGRPQLPPGLLTPRPAGDGSGEITVTGQRPRGSVIGDIPPERTFNPLDIRAFGAANIGELIQALGPQVSSSRGREDNAPVVLLNGKRVSSFAEIAKIPPEAIERMEVFPEEVALKYGYRADQKVVNVVAFERFKSTVGQVTYGFPTDGGRETFGVNASHLRIQGDTRYSLDGEYSSAGSLLESERGVQQAVGAPDLGRFRTLLPATERAVLNGTVSGNVWGDVSATLNGRFEANESESLLGLARLPDGGFDLSRPLARDTSTRLAHVGTALGGRAGKWLWSITGNYDRLSSETFTDTQASGARDEARSVNSLASAELVFSGSLLKLPSGDVSTSVRGGLEARDFSSRSLRGGAEQAVDLSRDRGSIQANVDIPLTSRSGTAMPWLGNLSVNLNAEAEELSDFGTLRTLGYGLNWSPSAQFSFIASVTNEEGAPTVEQLGNPLVVTPNVRTFDFTRGEVVDVTRIFGGNPDLRADDRRVLRLGVNAKPFGKTDMTLSATYTNSRTEDPIAPFPIVTPEIEAAFPERFTRGNDGRLLQIDGRPLNFERSQQEELRWGVNFTRPLGKMPAGMQGNVRFLSAGSDADIQKRLPPGATMIRAEAGSPLARRMEGMLSRLFISLYHTWHLENEILVREGVPELDLLDGSAVGSRGGQPRHELELEAGAFRGGLGARLSATWRSGTRVRGLPEGPGETAGDLFFSDYSTVNINLFANLADRVGAAKAPAWLKGTRASIGINNLFDSRPEVRDAAGLTPLSYQRAYLDPLGRSVTLSLRKVF